MINVVMQGEDVIELDMDGEVTAQDYKEIRPQLEAIFARKGKMKFLFDLTRVSRFTVGAVWEDIKMDLKNFKNIGTTTVVANRKLFKVLSKAVDSVYPEKIEHFENNQMALAWVKSRK